MKNGVSTAGAVVAALLLWGCSAGSPPPAQKSEATPAAAAASPSAAVAAAPEPAATAAPATPAAAEPGQPEPVLVAIAGADGHGKTTLLAAVSQSLAKRGQGKAAGYDELESGKGAEIAFDSGGRRLVLKEYPSHDALVKALGGRGSRPAGLVLVVAQAEGITKQTREEISAAGKAKLRPLLVVQTKDDIVDDAELKDLEQSEIEQALVDAGLLAEADAGTWEKGKYKPGTRLPFLRVSAKRALEGDAGAQKRIAELIALIEKRAPGAASR